MKFEKVQGDSRKFGEIRAISRKVEKKGQKNERNILFLYLAFL